MHQSQFFNRLWYHTGKLDLKSNTLIWGKSHLYDRGTFASVALDGQSLVETHTSDFFNSLYTNIGFVYPKGKTILWN